MEPIGGFAEARGGDPGGVCSGSAERPSSERLLADCGVAAGGVCVTLDLSRAGRCLGGGRSNVLLPASWLLGDLGSIPGRDPAHSTCVAGLCEVITSEAPKLPQPHGAVGTGFVSISTR